MGTDLRSRVRDEEDIKITAYHEAGHTLGTVSMIIQIGRYLSRNFWSQKFYRLKSVANTISV